ncbi:Vacuolar protein sorting-associated protein 33A [Geodia barretti]|uniref:Vacuolar protein sorting-associated protein 33A n=1 Tax=Geodia barretti TaxID=519541 RepID=A0AA35S597_GEOBA|nr:Vacuolar protein sorting-associated protein 33A [Geodia barretti]
MAAVTGAHLISNRLNAAQVLAAAQTELLELLGDPSVKKVIVWDPDLIQPMTIIAEATFIRKGGVTKMVRLPVTGLTERYEDASEFIFLVRPTLTIVDMVAEAIRTSKKKMEKRFTVAFTPHKVEYCVAKLRDLGLEHGSRSPVQFYINEYHLDILPLDSDVLSLDIPTAFKDLYVDQDPSPVYETARAIGKLQALFGVIPKIYGKGKNAKLVAELLKNVQGELERTQSKTGRQEAANIDSLILLDRSVDMVTPLSSQLTYEGLIDETYGIKYTVAKFPRHMFSEEVLKRGGESTGPFPVKLDSDDSMFSAMRDLNFRAVGVFLSDKAKEISAQFESRHDAKTVTQLKSFVEKLPHMQDAKFNLSKHTTIAELVKAVTDNDDFLSLIHTEQDLREEDYSDKPHPYIEKLLGNASHHPIEKVLKLICLQSSASNGLRARLLEQYKREVLHAYGYQHLNTLLQLEKAGLVRARSQEEKGGLLRAQETRGFPALRKQLQLVAHGNVVDDRNPSPSSMTYLFSGYAPLSVRLVEVLSRKQGFAAFEEVFLFALLFLCLSVLQLF